MKLTPDEILERLMQRAAHLSPDEMRDLALALYDAADELHKDADAKDRPARNED